MRRRALLAASATPAPPQKSNIIKATVRVGLDDFDLYGGYPLFGDEFDVSQVDWVRLVFSEDEKVDIPLDGNILLISDPGDHNIEIGLNTLTNGNWMFTDTRLLECDFSDVDISQLASCRAMFAGTLISRSPIKELNIPLSDYSCAGMFSYCEYLTVAPILSASAAPSFCYTQMFYGCTSLTAIRILATEIEETSLVDWLTDASPTGTLVKNADATWESPYIPDGWTVQTYGNVTLPAGLTFPMYIEADYCDEYVDVKECYSTSLGSQFYESLHQYLKDMCRAYGFIENGWYHLHNLSVYGVEIYVKTLYAWGMLSILTTEEYDTVPVSGSHDGSVYLNGVTFYREGIVWTTENNEE